MMMRRRLLAGFLIAVALLLSAISGLAHLDPRQTNSLFFLFLVELIAFPVGGAVAGKYLLAHRDLAPGLVGVGVYSLIVAGVVSVIYPRWLPSDNTILGTALLAGVWAGVGANLALASAAVLAGWSSLSRSAVSGVGAVVTFFLVAIGGMVWPLAAQQLPVLSVVAVIAAALGVSRGRRLRLVYPLVLALVGSVGTVAVLLVRGPGDWASASSSVKLYSFPILLMTLGVSLALIDIVASRDRRLRHPTDD